MHEELEGVAREALEATNTTPAVDAFALAAALGLRVCAMHAGGGLYDAQARTIYLSGRPMRLTRQHGQVAHEIGHALQQDHGLPDLEEGARYLAGALLVPREHLDRALRLGWSITRLRLAHPHASAEMLARRITQVRSSVATVFDGERVTVRVGSPWLDERLGPPSERERELAIAARAAATEIEEAGPIVASPAGRARVIVVRAA